MFERRFKIKKKVDADNFLKQEGSKRIQILIVFMIVLFDLNIFNKAKNLIVDLDT